MIYDKITDLNKENNFIVLKSGKSAEFSVDNIDKNNCHKLFFTCEDASTPTLKNESGAELEYMLIDDSLNFTESNQNRYCLDFSCVNPLPFPKRTLKKVMWQSLSYGLYPYENFTEYCSTWRFGIYAKAENLKAEDGGYLRVRLERWELKEGTNPHNTTSAPSDTYTLDITEGSYGYTEFEKTIEIPKDSTTCVIITLEGENYSGNVYFENPFIKDNEGRNVISEFNRGSMGLEKFAWLGQNLSKREWPEFEISVNGKVSFKGEVFLKVHRFSPIEIGLMSEYFTDGENKISIKYTSKYIDTIPVLINEVKLLVKEKAEFRLVRCPEEINDEKSVKLLFEVESPDIELKVESDDFAVECETDFAQFNLKVLSLKPKRCGHNLSFTVSGKNEKHTYNIKRTVKKITDNVIAGSGDMVYIDISKPHAVCDYIKWYVANDIGSFVTIRPVYRWGGQKYVNCKVWDMFRCLCESLDLYYVHISDGRDIPGLCANPPKEALCGKNFLGRQLHERDGQLFYWSPSAGHPREIAAPLEEFFDLAARLGREHPDTVEGSYRPFNIEWSDSGYSYRRNFIKTKDIAEIYNIAKGELSDLCRDEFTRHTGPAVMYKYFYQNGFEWTGAETMDGATEVLLAFIRGASKAYGKEKYGVHLALQWSTFPHDNLKRYRRYLLSLYIPYMHGVTDINTEEGLWFMEARYAYHNRLSEACEEHRKQLRRFNKFVRTHSRTGTFYTPFAFIHGRLDGWNGFLVKNVWGMPFIKPGDESDSWIHLKAFYPNDALDESATHKTGFVSPNSNEPFGTFSGTPRGNVDAVPMEHGDLSGYKLLIFAGYNRAEKSDLDRLDSYVKDGGTLICTWAHFTDTTLKDDIDAHRLNIVSHPLTDALSDGRAQFDADYINEKEIIVCKNIGASCEVVSRTDNGNALVCSFNFGKGKIIIVNTLYYPGNKTIYPIYKNVIENESDKVLASEDIRIKCNDDVQYSIFNQTDGTKHIYFTAVDWYNSSEDARYAKIILQEDEYEIAVPFGAIVKLVTDGKTAVWPANDFDEVTELCSSSFTCQGEGKGKFYIAKNSKITEADVDFSIEAEQKKIQF